MGGLVLPFWRLGLVVREGAKLMECWSYCGQGQDGLRMGLGIADKAVALQGVRRSKCFCRVVV